MFQFNRYQHPGESPELTSDFAALCRHYADFRDPGFMSRRALALLEKYPDSDKLLLVCARLHLWAGLEAPHHQVPPLLLAGLRERCARPLPHFAQQELLAIFGVPGLQHMELPTQPFATAIHLAELAADLATTVPPAQWERPGSDRAPIYFSPVASGFFSTIENILLMAYYAHQAGGRLVLAPERFWWRYGVPFATLFGALFELAHDSLVDQVGWYTRDGVAQWLADGGVSVHGGFFAFKHHCYPAIHAALHRYLEATGKTLDPVDGAALLFLRGGDKFAQETIAFPHGLIEEEITALTTQFDRVLLLSDDWNMADTLARQHASIHNITQPSSHGHQFATDVTADDVDKIVANFLVLCSAAAARGCPSSNLINAVNVCRRTAGRRNAVSRLFPTENYLLL